MTLAELFPEKGRILFTGSGKEFVEQLGLEAIRNSVLSVMLGENLRTQTEPLSRGKLAIVSGALIAMFLRGHVEIDNFTDSLSEMALEQLAKRGKGRDKVAISVAQWVIGLTQKQIQNVLRSDLDQIKGYVEDFEGAINEAAERCREDFGDVSMTLGFIEDKEGQRVELDWRDIARLTTAIGSQTLALRGSHKSMLGKLFERLILGSMLTILGFERVNRDTNSKTEGVFWLSDSKGEKGERERDATLLVRPGQLVYFDIGFIGPGNSEISKDKLTRWGREAETADGKVEATTFIIVDRLPATGKTQKLADRIDAEIVQMSMGYWMRDLSGLLHDRFGVEHEIQDLENGAMAPYLKEKLSQIAIQDFLSDLSTEELEDEAEDEAEESQVEEE
ncbi:MAG TPA: CfrBI family restriction endonuclease [Pyrinomonadaceae bacterium]|nr:CfrBI family restriction endonuclease [Pyrinomonadaceae bacterium]